MKDYYGILGVPRTASANAMRDAYRKLAKQYHPDINKGDYAETFFKEVNEAYEILSDPEKKAKYDQPTVEYVIDPPAPRHRDRAYHKQSRPSDFESASQRLARLSEEYKIYFVWICRVGLAFSLLLGVDRILPTSLSKENIISTTYSSYRRIIMVHLHTDKGREIVLYPENYNGLNNIVQDNVIVVEVSLIFSTVFSLQDSSGKQAVWIERLYTTLSFFPILLFLASLVGELKKQKTDLVLNCGTISLVMALICMVILVY